MFTATTTYWKSSFESRYAYKKGIGTIQPSLFTALSFVNIGFYLIESRARSCLLSSIGSDTMANPQQYRFGFNGMEKDPEITGQEGSHYTASFWEYDTRIARRWNVDPVTYPWHSPYATFNNNPILFLDIEGDEPREGNRVLKIDFTRCYIANSENGLIKGLKSRRRGINVYDRHLKRSALDRLSHVTDISPGGSFIPWPKPFQIYFQLNGDLQKLDLESSITQTNLAYSWVMATRSKEGYMYVEYLEQDDRYFIVNRDVVNLNEELGDEGFENVVREKTIFEIYENGERNTEPESIEYFLYRTVENENGDKIVQTRSVLMDFTVDGSPDVTHSEWEEALPGMYTPTNEEE